MDADLKREVTRLKNLQNTKDLPEAELERAAKINLFVREFKAQPLFTKLEEQALAENRFKAYLEANQIESMSEIDTLRSLIYNEVFESRIQKELNKIAEKEQFPNDRLTAQLTDVQNQKLDLKVKLELILKTEKLMN